MDTLMVFADVMGFVVAEYQVNLMERLAGCDAVVVMVAHSAYRDLDLGALKSALRLPVRPPVLVNRRRLFEPGNIQTADLAYRRVGMS